MDMPGGAPIFCSCPNCDFFSLSVPDVVGISCCCLALLAAVAAVRGMVPTTMQGTVDAGCAQCTDRVKDWTTEKKAVAGFQEFCATSAQTLAPVIAAVHQHVCVESLEHLKGKGGGYKVLGAWLLGLLGVGSLGFFGIGILRAEP